jgi:Arc/MetJ family transcription regulator
MRTNIVIDDKLMESVLKNCPFKTKREAVEEGLRLLLKLNMQSKIREFRGKLKWEGNLENLRKDKKNERSR